MALFLHIFIDILSATVAAMGFLAFHVAVQNPTRAIKIAGIILIAAGFFSWAGNTYYGLQYLRAGYFDTPATLWSKPQA